MPLAHPSSQYGPTLLTLTTISPHILHAPYIASVFFVLDAAIQDLQKLKPADAVDMRRYKSATGAAESVVLDINVADEGPGRGDGGERREIDVGGMRNGGLNKRDRGIEDGFLRADLAVEAVKGILKLNSACVPMRTEGWEIRVNGIRTASLWINVVKERGRKEESEQAGSVASA